MYYQDKEVNPKGSNQSILKEIKLVNPKGNQS